MQNKFPEIVTLVNKELGKPVEEPIQNQDGLDPFKEEKPMYKFRNGRTVEPIYADSKHTVKVGQLNKYEVCDCYGIFDGAPIVRYKLDGKNNYKIRFCSR